VRASGGTGSVRPYGTVLVVVASRKVHAEVSLRVAEANRNGRADGPAASPQ
jgi:hypothetical protein